MSRRIVTSLVLIVVGCGVAACGGDQPPDGEPSPAEAAATMPRVAPDAGPLVDVAGHVRTPGVYRLPVGARVHAAIEAAGGARAGADLSTINRAATVTDGQQLVVVARGGAGEPAGGAAGAAGAKVSLARATIEQLDGLPGIGPVTAANIIAERESGGAFTSVDDLDRVSGIGPATLEQLRELVVA